MIPRTAIGVASQFLALGASIVLGLAGCTRSTFSERATAPLSTMHDTRPVISAAIAPERMRITGIELPFPITRDGVILVGNVHSRRGSELIVVDRGGIAVLGTDGEIVSVVDPPEHVLKAGVLADVDGDRLADIITGVTGRADPTIRAFNGLGKEIATLRVEVAGRVAGSVHPVALVDDGILVLVGESSPDGPRGVLRLDLPGMAKAWFAAVPTGLDGAQLVVGGKSLAISNHTQHHGEFNEIGVGREITDGFDSRPRVVFVSRHGEIVAQTPVAVRDDSLDQSIWLLPHSEGSVLAHLVEDVQTLSVIDASTTDSVGHGGPRIVTGTVEQLIVSPQDDLIGCVCTFSDDGGWEISITDPDLTTLARWTGENAPPHVLAVVRQSSNLSLLAIHGGELVLLDDGGIHPTGHQTSITHGVTVVESEASVLIAGLGDGLEVIEVAVGR